MERKRVAVVTGGGSGIGRGIALRLSEAGMHVVPADISKSASEETLSLLREKGGTGTASEIDVTNKASVTAEFSRLAEELGGIDVLVNNAGIDKKDWVWGIPEETWDRVMSINLKGVFLCSQAVAQGMKAQQYGRIVNISSIAGKTGEERTSPYCASKFGVIGFTQSVALELAPFGVTVNAVCPAAVETDMVKSRTTATAKEKGISYEEELQESIVRHNPVGRIGKVEDVAHAVAFLAEEKSSFITGSTINVAGGREMH